MKRGKRILAVLLSLALVAGMMPAFTLTANAADPVTCLGYKCTSGNGYIKSVKLNGVPLESTGNYSGLKPGQTASLTVEISNEYKGHYIAQSAFSMMVGGNAGNYPLTGDQGIFSGTITIPDKDFVVAIEISARQYQVLYCVEKYSKELGTFYYDYETAVTVKDPKEFGSAAQNEGFEAAGWIDDQGRAFKPGETFTAKKENSMSGKMLYIQWKEKEPTHTVIEGPPLNVRQGPGTDQTRIGGLTAGKKVVVVETKDGWCRIVYGSGYGWVDGHYLKAIPYTERKNPFVDVSKSEFYYEAVMWAYYAEPQVTNGIDDTHFGPMQAVTRGQAVTFLWRSEGCESGRLLL